MRSLTETSMRIISKVPNAEWVSEHVEKWLTGCHRGYAQLQSGMISRGRMTMQDKSDEKKTAAWSQSVWVKDGGVAEWPKALRPQRPEQVPVTRWKQAQMSQKRQHLHINPDVDIFDNPPVFLTMKDAKKKADETKVTSPEKREKRPSTPGVPKRVRGSTKDMEADGTQDVELLGMEIIRELSVFNEELTKKREQVEDQSKKLKENLKESEDLRMKLKKTEGEVEEVRAQLRVRTEATQRLEQYNATLRDTVARLQVQVDTNSEERDRLIQRWHSAEEERQKLKSECEKLQDEVATTNSYKQQCQLLFDQIRTNISRVTSQQELLQKDLSRLEQATQDSLTFSQSVDARGKLRESQANELALVADQAHTKLIHMSALLTELKKDKNVSVAEKPADNRTDEFFLEWENYQDMMQKRVEAVMAENGRLMEELALTREAQPLNVCPACLNDIVTK